MNSRSWIRQTVAAMATAVTAAALLLGAPGQVAAEPSTVPTVAGTYQWATADPSHVAALNAAYSMIGTPYRAGGATPAGFDCSGLVNWSFARAGIQLPRTSRSMAASTFAIGAHALRPGDLVFWGSPVYHVAIYVGDNQIIHSPRTGSSVIVRPMKWLGTPSSYGRVK